MTYPISHSKLRLPPHPSAFLSNVLVWFGVVWPGLMCGPRATLSDVLMSSVCSRNTVSCCLLSVCPSARLTNTSSSSCCCCYCYCYMTVANGKLKSAQMTGSCLPFPPPEPGAYARLTALLAVRHLTQKWDSGIFPLNSFPLCKHHGSIYLDE